MEGAGLTVTTCGPAAILPTGFMMELDLFFLGSLSDSKSGKVMSPKVVRIWDLVYWTKHKQ